jgi:hypothetical protein
MPLEGSGNSVRSIGVAPACDQNQQNVGPFPRPFPAKFNYGLIVMSLDRAVEEQHIRVVRFSHAVGIGLIWRRSRLRLGPCLRHNS